MAQKCPFDAILIINLPRNLAKETTHRYGVNSFKLHRCALERDACLTTRTFGQESTKRRK